MHQNEKKDAAKEFTKLLYNQFMAYFIPEEFQFILVIPKMLLSYSKNVVNATGFYRFLHHQLNVNFFWLFECQTAFIAFC